MKKFYLILVIFSLLFIQIHSLNASEVTVNKNNLAKISFSSVTDYDLSSHSVRMSNSNKEYQNKELFRKYQITKKTSKAFIISGGVCSGLGSLFMLTSAIMGFIPYSSFPEEMKVYDSFIYGNSSLWRIDYPYMTAYASVGVSLLITGALMFLFCLPVLIYGSVVLFGYNKAEKQQTVSLSGNGLTIQIGNIKSRRML